MDIRRVLSTPKGELDFIYPKGIPRDQHDCRYGTLRSDLGHRGLRHWWSFAEKPAYIQKLLSLPTGLPADWLPRLHPWDRYAASELSIADYYKKTMIHRVNIGLETVSPGLHIVGTPRYFPSYGTYDNRIEGDTERLVGPDLVVLDTDMLDKDFHPPNLQNLGGSIVTIGEFKQKDVEFTDEESVLPGTLSCYESWLAQPVQCCLDLRISLGFLLTNIELVIFHLVKLPSSGSQMNSMTLRSKNMSGFDALRSDATQEAVFSSPVIRKRNDWVSFHEGDSDIPDVSNQDLMEKLPVTPVRHSQTKLETPRTPHRPSSSPLARRKRARTNILEVPDNSQESVEPPSTPTPDPRVEQEPDGNSHLPSSVQCGTASPSEFEVDHRGEDPGYILIRSYQTTNNDEVAERLFEHIMLAKRAKDLGLLEMAHFKLSHSALDEFEPS
ncbi:hypothetical protein J3459_018336 [Metarhizium acridum]|nr:hypothetical protein J3459_022356 [Metarhizium acridum]KAG8407802.1 hypothetical protein J3459_018336 [Metarhizium acridum]